MTYAIGDLHGEVTLLQQLLTILPLQEQETLVFLGDYMDRGEDSIATILALAVCRRDTEATLGSVMVDCRNEKNLQNRRL